MTTYCRYTLQFRWSPRSQTPATVLGLQLAYASQHPVEVNDVPMRVIDTKHLACDEYVEFVATLEGEG